MPGGKGVNVARALKRLGQPVIATGLAGGATGMRIVDAADAEDSILNSFVRIHEESRTNTSVLDPTNGQHTEINERGPSVSLQELELFRDKLLYLAQGASMCVFAGSLPRGLDPGVYAELIRDVRKLRRADGWSDTEGDPLQLAMRAGARTSSRRTSSRPKSSWATSSTAVTRTARIRRVRDDPPRRGRGDHDGARRLLRAG